MIIFAINAVMQCFGKNPWWFNLLILFAVLIISWPRINDLMTAWNLDSVAPVELLIEKFELTVYRNDLESKGYVVDGRLSKWEAPIRVRLHGEEHKRFRPHIKKTLATLARLSGLPIHLNKDNAVARGNLDIYIAPRDQFVPIFMSYGNDRNSATILSDAICPGNTIYRGNIGEHDVTIILNSLSDGAIKHCLIEEITQGLGLHADTDILQPSIMSDNIHQIDRLPLNDKIMVRTLYDKRLKPGMTSEEAMPIVRVIIRELVAAVKEHGEEALYQ